MGTALGKGLRRAGYCVKVVVTKHERTARRAAKLIGGEAFPAVVDRLANSATLAHLVESELILVSVPDDALGPAAEQMAAWLRAAPAIRRRKRPVALHTSGATSSRVLDPLADLGFATGSIHPMVSIADGGNAGDVFRGVHFCVEGDRDAVRVARSLVKSLGGTPFTIRPDAKPLYHAAGTISSGHVVALFDLAIEMLTECGVSPRRAQRILAPLLASMAANLVSKSPADALTGPLARGDLATIKKHVISMKSKKMEPAAAIYAALGLRALELAPKAKPESGNLAKIAKLLAQLSTAS